MLAVVLGLEGGHVRDVGVVFRFALVALLDVLYVVLQATPPHAQLVLLLVPVHYLLLQSLVLLPQTGIFFPVLLH